MSNVKTNTDTDIQTSEIQTAPPPVVTTDAHSAVFDNDLVYRLEADQADRAQLATRSPFYRFMVNSWTQIVLVALAAFGLPGMYNAISGMGGSGQVDPTVS